MDAPEGRTLTGAWIETGTLPLDSFKDVVAPSRVRGLKLAKSQNICYEGLSHPHGCVD